MKKRERKEIPEIGELKAELHRVNYKRRYIKVFKSTVYTLVVVAAFAVLVATLWMPVLQIYGSSMTPTTSSAFPIRNLLELVIAYLFSTTPSSADRESSGSSSNPQKAASKA